MEELDEKIVEREVEFTDDWYMVRKMERCPILAEVIHWADTHPNWIKVEDRLPERDGGHLLTKNMLVNCPGPSDYDGEPNVTIAFYNHCTKQWYDIADNSIKVTHWLPIVLPKED